MLNVFCRFGPEISLVFFFYFLSEQKVNKNSPATIKRLKIAHKNLKIENSLSLKHSIFLTLFINYFLYTFLSNAVNKDRE